MIGDLPGRKQARNDRFRGLIWTDEGPSPTREGMELGPAPGHVICRESRGDPAHKTPTSTKHTKCGLHVRRTSVAPKGCRRFLISTQPTTDVRERLAVPSRCHSWIVNRDTLHSSHPWHSTQRAAEGSLKRKATCGPRVGLGLHRITAVQSCQPPHQQEKRAHAGSSLTLEPSQAAFRGPSFRTLSMSLVCCRESLCQTKSSGIISTRAGSTGYPSTKCDALQRSFATASSRAWLIDSPSMMTAPPSRNVSHHSVISVPPRCSEDPGQPIRVKAGSSRKSPRPRTRLIKSAWRILGVPGSFR
jgi:hypothetical protein